MKIKYKIKLIFTILLLTFLTFIPNFISVNASTSLIVGGESIGMELKGNGLIVSNTTTIHYDDKSYNPTNDSDIKIGDLIYEIDNEDIKSIKDLEKIISRYNENIIEVPIKIKRNNEVLDRKLKIFKIENNFKTGLFVKEKILGIGTLTFIDPKTKKYAALGHEVKDSDYNDIYPISSGLIYDSNVNGIKRSVNGVPGEKLAQINKNNVLGTIDKNTIFGIYGNYNGKHSNKTIETSDNVNKGKAYIRTVINGNKVNEYEINITNIKEQNSKQTKGFSFEVVDKELLKETNGIVQGMSGSPIIQDGKLIGAVTHVIIDDCTCGHAIYIRWMIDEMHNI